MSSQFNNITIGNSSAFNADDFDTTQTPTEARQSESRRKVLERYANAHAPVGETVDLYLSSQMRSAFAMDPDSAGAGPDAATDLGIRDRLDTDADYVIFVTSKKQPIELEETEYQNQLILDYATQCAFILHEIGHVLYTDFEAYFEEIHEISDGVPDNIADEAASIFNAFEDGAIERAVRLDTTERAAERQKLLNHFLRVRCDSKTYSWLTAITLAGMDLSIYDTGTLGELLDPANESFTFAGQAHRDIFLTLLPKIVDLRDEVLYSPDPEHRYESIANFWKVNVEPLLELGQQPDQNQQQANQNQQQGSQSQQSGESGQSSEAEDDGASQQSGQNQNPSDDDAGQDTQQAGEDASQSTSGRDEGQSPDAGEDSESAGANADSTDSEAPGEDTGEGGQTDSQQAGSQSEGTPSPDEVPSPDAGSESQQTEHFPDDFSRAASAEGTNDQQPDLDAKPADQAPAPTESQSESEDVDETGDQSDPGGDGDRANEAPQLTPPGADNGPEDESEGTVDDRDSQQPDSDSGNEEAGSESGDEQEISDEASGVGGDATGDEEGEEPAEDTTTDGNAGEQSPSDTNEGAETESGSTDTPDDQAAEGDETGSAGDSSTSEGESESVADDESTDDGASAEDASDDDSAAENGQTTFDSFTNATGDSGDEGAGNDASEPEKADSGDSGEKGPDAGESGETGPASGEESGNGAEEGGDESSETGDTEKGSQTEDLNGGGDTKSESPDSPGEQSADESAGQEGAEPGASDGAGEPGNDAGNGAESGAQGEQAGPETGIDGEASSNGTDSAEGPGASQNTPSPDIPGGSEDLNPDEEYLNDEAESVESQLPDTEPDPELENELDRLEQSLNELNREYDASQDSSDGSGSDGAGSSGMSQESLKVLPTSGDDARETERWTNAMGNAGTTGHGLKQALSNSQRDSRTRGRSSGSFDSGRASAFAVGKTTCFEQRDFGGDKKYALIIVLDRSKSMAPYRGTNLVETAEEAVAQFGKAAEDIGIEVSIFDFYDGEIRVPCPFGTPVEHAADSIVTGDAKGGTPLSDALSLARERVRQEASRSVKPLMLVVTDGKPANKSEYLAELERANKEIPSIMGLTLAPGINPEKPPEKFSEQAENFNSHEFVTTLTSDEITKKLEDVALRSEQLRQ